MSDKFDTKKILKFFNDCKKVIKFRELSDDDYCVIVYEDLKVRFIYRDLDDFMSEIEESVKITNPDSNVTFQMFIFD